MEKIYFVDSKYANIRSRIVSENTDHIDSFAEYPVTKNSTVNKTLSEFIDTLRSQFKKDVSNRTPPENAKFSEKISYTVSFNEKNFLSIVVNGNFDTIGAHPYSTSKNWTFDMSSGTVVGLKDLVGESGEGLNILKTRLSKALNKKYGEGLAGDLTDDNLSSFLVQDQNNLAFHFDQASVLPSSSGPADVLVPIDQSLAPYLQNTLAKSLFDVPKLPQKPAETPQISGGDCKNKKCIALTFDDGPGPYTNKLLDILKQQNVKASFFLLGQQIAGREAMLKRELAEGHEIGSHTWSHSNLNTLSKSSIASEVSRTNQEVKRVIGKEPKLLRPPYGNLNDVGRDVLRQQSMPAIMWSIDTRDWENKDSSVVCSRAVANARPGGIILIHDIHASSVDAVPCITNKLSAQGYTFVTISQLLGTNLNAGQSYFSGN